MNNFEFSLTMALGLVALVVIGGVVAAIVFSKRIEGEQDENVSNTQIKHKVIANPIYWWYVFFVVAIIVGVYMVYVWKWSL